ncbi:MAG: glycine cleavage system protein GcvH [Actinomycetota bacterium]|nr:glycine cleavage system protein GcvH [Actinomycetota bacterium]
MTVIHEDLHYTTEHEWVRLEGDLAEVGITDYAQEALGDIVYVSLPKVGDTVDAGQPCGEVESTKSVSDIYAPLSGTVVDINDNLDGAPESINEAPYAGGWLFKLRISDPSQTAGLLTSAQYEDQTRA